MQQTFFWCVNLEKVQTQETFRGRSTPPCRKSTVDRIENGSFFDASHHMHRYKGCTNRHVENWFFIVFRL